MAELTDPGGRPVDVDAAEVEQEFARAMSATVNGDTPASAPPKRAPAADKPAPKRRGRPPKAEQARTVAAPAATGLSDDARAAGVKGIIQLGAGGALIASRATGQDAFKADAITLASSADAWADACVDAAKQDPKFARLLDRVVAVGPYGALVSVAMSTGLQVARNHKPSTALPGTVDPAKLIEQAEAASEPAAA